MSASRLLLTLTLAVVVGLVVAEAGPRPQACRDLTVLDDCRDCCDKNTYQKPDRLDENGKCVCYYGKPCRDIKNDASKCYFCCRQLDNNIKRSSLMSHITGQCHCRLTLSPYN